VPLLVGSGHEVTAMTRSPSRVAALTAQGAAAVVCDVFDGERLTRILDTSRPDAVIHEMTSIPPEMDMRRIAQQMAATNRLRTEGTQRLLEAAASSGARRFVAQSIALAYAPGSDGPATEDEPLYSNAPGGFDTIVSAVEDCERAVMAAAGGSGIALRYGTLYGPGTIFTRDGSFAQLVRRRRVPLVGSGSGRFSFLHVDDAARATVTALSSGETGVFNVVDDEPARVGDWLPFYAERIGAPRPMRLPAWLARMVAGAWAVEVMTRQRGASNAKARERLGWRPVKGSWRDGIGAAATGGPWRVPDDDAPGRTGATLKSL